MNQLHKTLFALAFCLGSGTASAATIPLIFSNANGSFAAAFSDTVAANAFFNDYYTFSISSAASGTADVIASFGVSPYGAFLPNVQFTSFQLGTLDASGFTSMSPGSLASPFGANSMASVSFNGLSKNTSYALNVAGTGASGGTYAGNISLTATNPQTIAVVPEPGEFELMLAGFGFIGLVGRIKSGMAVSK